MMANYSLYQKLRHVWNWFRGKRIIHSDPKHGRVMIRTGYNSANRNNGGQWYLQRYENANGLLPLPLCSRSRLDNPVTILQAERFTGDELTQAKCWYEIRQGVLQKDQDLELDCVYDPNGKAPESRIMHYRPNEIFEIEFPWLSLHYNGPAFVSYFGTWYGSGLLKENDFMDFEIFWNVGPKSQPLLR
jgi:hypothetical protein